MQITLCEDDGVFHDGVPTLVVLVVKFDDGKIKRIPYPAEKTISALYQDLTAIAPTVETQKDLVIDGFIEAKSKAGVATQRQIWEDAYKGHPDAKEGHLKEASKPPIDKSNIIEKEDIVTCIKIDENRDKDATCDLMVGMDYRVQAVIGPSVTLPGRNDTTKIIQGYDVVVAEGDNLRRIRVLPHEIQLKSKRKPPVATLERKIEEILPCPSCQTKNGLVLEGSEFKGVCVECQQEIVIARIIKPCQNPECLKDENKVSCFDVGGMYVGKCNKCGAKIEVPYA